MAHEQSVVGSTPSTPFLHLPGPQKRWKEEWLKMNTAQGSNVQTGPPYPRIYLPITSPLIDIKINDQSFC